MKYEQRRETMLKMLKTSDIIDLKTLVEELHSSEATIRRDIIRMEKEGVIKRYWGGIKRVENDESIRSKSLHSYFDERSSAIGKTAVSYIEDGDLIYIGSGSTTLAMIPHLEDNQKITVITNGIPQLQALYEKGIRALLLCGFYKEYSQSTVGTETSEMLERYRFDKAFIGANGIGEDYSILSADDYEDSLKRLAIRNARKTFCLVKSDKFDRIAYYRIDPEISRKVVLITDEAKKDEDKWQKKGSCMVAEIRKLKND